MNVKAITGKPGWCVVFIIDSGLYAMVNLNAGDPVQVSTDLLTFTKHGYFEPMPSVSDEDLRKAEENLQHFDWQHARQLWDEGKLILRCPRNVRSELLSKMEEFV